ncbi:MAG: FtsX-like permease family protein [Bacilli bacterium]|jgi:predicted lysophospholipase L1 biosynthesis ABC-type transport system permease subunit
MLIGIKDLAKLFAITIVICCATFVCTLFLNRNIDLIAAKDLITTEQGMVIYEAQLASGKVTVLASGIGLAGTALVLLVFYVKNYIDSHGKELGILKALGHSNFSIAKHFVTFGLSVLVGSILGFIASWIYMSEFYNVMNKDHLYPDFSPNFNIGLSLIMLFIPALVFALFSVLYAYLKLKKPVMMLLKDRKEEKTKIRTREIKDTSFLKELKTSNLVNNKILCFFVILAGFCFANLIQMSMSMKKLNSGDLAWLMITIGLTIAIVSLLLSLSTVIKGNSKTIAMMKVFGYSSKEYSSSLLGGYRPFAYIGFAIGTLFQHFLLKFMVEVTFKDFEELPEYSFSVKGLVITLALFFVAYELAMYVYMKKAEKQSIKVIMLE